MPISKAQQRAVAKYTKNNYDSINLRLPKGYKDRIRHSAMQEGISINEYIKRAVDACMGLLEASNE